MTLGEKLNSIEDENKELKKFKKDIEKVLKKYDKKEAEKDDEKAKKIMLDFASKICTYYDLHTDQDISKWEGVMLNEKSREFWNGKRNVNKSAVTPHTEA